MSQKDRDYLVVLTFVVITNLVARYVSYDVAVMVFLSGIVAGLGYIANKLDDLK